MTDIDTNPETLGGYLISATQNLRLERITCEYVAFGSTKGIWLFCIKPSDPRELNGKAINDLTVICTTDQGENVL